MTIGEYALMVNGEGWMENSVSCDLEVIQIRGYDRRRGYLLPVKPSPNLPDWQSVYLYPSTALFEGTVISEGRGTERPFQLVGHPDLSGLEEALLAGDDLEPADRSRKAYGLDSPFREDHFITFTPVSIPGASLHPKHQGKECCGLDLRDMAGRPFEKGRHFTLYFVMQLYKAFPDNEKFFNSFFSKLAGNDRLRAQIEAGWDETEIRDSWAADTEKFRNIRKKYLIYPDYKIW
jgi:uncharacterized protein YbbC (DUF1343 family)